PTVGANRPGAGRRRLRLAIDSLAGRRQCGARHEHPLPCLVVTDLNLPKKSGLEVLQWIRHQPCLKKLVVVMFSSSTLGKDMDMAYELGANAYIQKSPDPKQLNEIAYLLKEWWLGQNHFAPSAESK